MDKEKIIIFDFDGVFVDDFDFHKRHIENFLGIKFDDKAFYDIHNVIRDEFLTLPIIEGMANVSKKAQEIAQSFIVSSGSENNIRDFFVTNGVCENLCTIYGVETNPSKEKKFEKILNETGIMADNIIFVTDTLGDIHEANTMGIASIAITWGFHREDTLLEGRPFAIAHKAEDITNLIEQYFEI